MCMRRFNGVYTIYSRKNYRLQHASQHLQPLLNLAVADGVGRKETQGLLARAKKQKPGVGGLRP